MLYKNNDKNPKLRTYKLFKLSPKFEPYLLLSSYKHRHAISKFRTSSHHLAVETGRHHRPKPLPLQERLCTNCMVLEDELHHLIQCKCYDQLRQQLFNVVLKYIPNFNNINEVEQFQSIMRNPELELQAALGNYLIKANDLRRS